MSKSAPSGPKTKWGGPNGGRGGGKPGQFSAGKLGLVLAWVLCPLGMILGWPLTVAATRGPLHGWRRAGALLLVTPLAVAVVLVMVFHGVSHYLTPWSDVWHTIVHASDDAGMLTADRATGATHAGVPEQLRELVADRWGAWVLAQLPLALCAALTRAGWVLWRQQRLSPDWRQKPEPKLADLSEKRRAKAAAADERKLREVRKLSDAAEVPEFDKLQMTFAVNNHGNALRLFGEQFTAHMLLLGGSGFGKTITMMRIAYGWLCEWNKNQLPMVMMDFKADPKVIWFARGLARLCGRGFHLITADGKHETYNALAHATPAQVADRLVEMLDSMPATEFQNTYYRGKGTRWLITVATALDNLAAQGKTRKDAPEGPRTWRRDLPDLAHLAELGTLRGLTPQLSGATRAQVQRHIKKLDPNPPKTTPQADLMIGGMTDALALLVEMGAANALLFEQDRNVDLEQCIREGDVVLFSLDSAENAAAARTIGNLAVADLLATFSRLDKDKWSEDTGKRCLVWLDEFGGLGGNLLERFVERTRSQGGTLMLSAQDDSTLERVSPDFRQTIMANSIVHLLHQQYGESAEDHAKAIGTHEGWKETIQVMEDASLEGSRHSGSGVGSLRDVQTFVVDPNEMKQLGRGEIILFSRLPRIVERCKVTPAPVVPDAQDDKPSTAAASVDDADRPGEDTMRVDLSKDDAAAVVDVVPEGPEADEAEAVKSSVTIEVQTREVDEQAPAKPSPQVADVDGWDVGLEDGPPHTAPPEEMSA